MCRCHSRYSASKLSNLLHGEDESVEKTLQLFVCNVDAQLLEAVHGKVLKAKHVQNADGDTLRPVK